MRIAKRRAFEQSDDFKKRYRWRAGVEATISEYNRRTGVKVIKGVRSCETLKALVMDMFRELPSEWRR